MVEIHVCSNCLMEFENKVPFEHECSVEDIEKRQAIDGSL